MIFLDITKGFFMELNITVSFHKMVVLDSEGKLIPSSKLQTLLTEGFAGLQTDDTNIQKRMFEDYGLYVAKFESDRYKCYMFVQDSRDGYAEKIYKPGNEVISTDKNDTRSRKFFTSLDFSDPNIVFICNSYLGQYGCFFSIHKAIKKILSKDGYKLDIQPIIVNSEFSHYFEQGEVKNIEITHYKPICDVAEQTWYKTKGTFSISSASGGKTGKDVFSLKMKDILSKQSREEIATNLLKGLNIISSDDKIAITESEITSQNLGNIYIKLYVKFGNQVRPIDFMKGLSSLATRFIINGCEKDQDGNPSFESIKLKSDEILDIDLKDRIK